MTMEAKELLKSALVSTVGYKINFQILSHPTGPQVTHMGTLPNLDNPLYNLQHGANDLIIFCFGNVYSFPLRGGGATIPTSTTTSTTASATASTTGPAVAFLTTTIGPAHASLSSR